MYISTFNEEGRHENLHYASRRNARTERLTLITSKGSDTLEENSPVKWNHTRNLHLMVAYGAVVYSRTVSADEEITTRLVISKCRVILTKRVTIPRLELLAALVAARLVTYMAGQLSLMIDQITCWSDEKVTASWIKSPRNGSFVMGKISFNSSNNCPSPVPAATVQHKIIQRTF
ncbi:hypothetical protein T07_6014 [Trichinella nelsoni]|uniref:Uncharacterized protein n=1 Tax=Trichinella nelsoni TaxID=6336 RepID=A0A0V0SIN7_9BILA|nr:hypothetical protein T07_6014 [Trichinella nelsoni]